MSVKSSGSLVGAGKHIVEENKTQGKCATERKNTVLQYLRVHGVGVRVISDKGTYSPVHEIPEIPRLDLGKAFRVSDSRPRRELSYMIPKAGTRPTDNRGPSRTLFPKR